MIVMELADCNLWDRFRECRAKGLPGIPRDELLLYMAETAEVLDLMNDQFQLQHLDIKPQNLFLLHNHVKVADFGQVKDLRRADGRGHRRHHPGLRRPGDVRRHRHAVLRPVQPGLRLPGTAHRQRPFDGCSMSQLLMQHLKLPPNLDPVARVRPAGAARALAKKPEDRWPSVDAFVRGLLERLGVGADHASQRPGRGPRRRGATSSTPSPPPPATRAGAGSAADSARAARRDRRHARPARHATETGGPVFTPAPAEVTGPGPLRPALVIGLGQTGLRVLQRLRYDLTERYGPPEMTPIVQSLLHGHRPRGPRRRDPHRPGRIRLAALEPDDMFPAKLAAPAHYLKPRLNGRSLTEGWFDPQLLYKIPRTPQTMGMRLFGRLAFFDHYRPLMGKIHADLDTASRPTR